MQYDEVVDILRDKEGSKVKVTLYEEARTGGRRELKPETGIVTISQVEGEEVFSLRTGRGAHFEFFRDPTIIIGTIELLEPRRSHSANAADADVEGVDDPTPTARPRGRPKSQQPTLMTAAQVTALIATEFANLKKSLREEKSPREEDDYMEAAPRRQPRPDRSETERSKIQELEAEIRRLRAASTARSVQDRGFAEVAGMELAAQIGQASRGVTRPVWTLANAELLLQKNLDDMWKPFSPARYLATATPRPTDWYTDFIATKSHLMPIVTGSPVAGEKGGAETARVLQMDLRMATASLRMSIEQCRVVPTSKAEWFPFYQAAKLMSLLATLTFGFRNGGNKVLFSFDSAWGSGNFDQDKLWPAERNNFRKQQ